MHHGYPDEQWFQTRGGMERDDGTVNLPTVDSSGWDSEPYVFLISTSCRRTDEPVSHDQNLHVDFPFLFLPDPLHPPTVTWRHLPNAIDSASKFG